MRQKDKLRDKLINGVFLKQTRFLFLGDKLNSSIVDLRQDVTQLAAGHIDSAP